MPQITTDLQKYDDPTEKIWIIQGFSIRIHHRKGFGMINILVQRVVKSTVYPKKYAHGFVVLCFVVVMQSFIMNSHEVFIHIHQGCFAGTGAIVRLPQCQWSKPDGYGKISQRITTTKHSKAKTVCIFLGIYCMTTVWDMEFLFSHYKWPYWLNAYMIYKILRAIRVHWFFVELISR